MNFREFYKTWFKQAYFTSNQIYAWHSGFDKNNLSRWVKNGLLVKVDLNKKAKDFEHLVFQERNSKRILLFGKFVEDL